MNKSDLTRNLFMLKGPLASKGYDWWWHSFTGYHEHTKEPKAFFIEYFTINPALAKEQPVFGQLKGEKPSYVMLKAGAWGKNAKQIHNFYPYSQFKNDPTKLNIKVGECTLTETHMKGSCKVTEEEAKNHPEYMSDAGSMEWDLTIDKQITYNVGYGANKIFRTMNAFEMFWHAEGMKTEYSGEVVLDGEKYIVIPEKSYGYADKNWGADFTSPWLWISSCRLVSLLTNKELTNSVVEFGGGRPKVLGFPLNRKLLGCFYYEGKMYEYNFSKFWNRSKITFSFEEGETIHTWKLHARNEESSLELTLHCKKEEMLLINYEAPNGKKLHNRLWNGGTGYGEMKLYDHYGKLIDYISINNAGCEYGEYDKK